jgi:hypothetical protein
MISVYEEPFLAGGRFLPVSGRKCASSATLLSGAFPSPQRLSLIA